MPYPQSPWETAADVPLAFSLWHLSRTLFYPELVEVGLLPDEPETLFGGKQLDLYNLDEETA